MASSTSSLCSTFFIVLLFVISILGTGPLKLVNGQIKTWCVAKPSSSDIELAANIQFACSQVRDCKALQEGGQCYYPNTPINHASVAMNLYYEAVGRNPWNCDFRTSGLITQSDPSYGSCHYA